MQAHLSAPAIRTILLASVLKPVDDTRMRGKFAETLAAAGARVAVAGRASPSAAATASISLHPLFSGSRLSWARLLAQVRYWRLLRRLQPGLVVVHAPELLPLTLLWQGLGRGRQFLYDIRENYALNVSTQGVYQGGAKRLLAAGLRWVEGLAARRAAALLLAEASYAAELPYLAHQPASRVLVLENKYQPASSEVLPAQPSAPPLLTEPLRLLYSGTISELNGVQEAIALAAALHEAWPGGAALTIIGFCQQPALLAQLQQLVATQPLIYALVGGGEPVPHAAIVAQVRRSHLGLLPYQPHPSSWRCRPTKLFEYLAHGLPVAIPPNPLWEAEVQAYQAGLAVNFTAPQAAAAALVQAMQNTNFYAGGLPGGAVLWAGEGKRLRHLVESLLPGPAFRRAEA